MILISDEIIRGIKSDSEDPQDRYNLYDGAQFAAGATNVHERQVEDFFSMFYIFH